MAAAKKTSSDRLKELRAVRDELKPLLAKVAKLEKQRNSLISELAGYDKARADRIAPAAGLSIAEVTTLAPQLASPPEQAPTPQPHPPAGQPVGRVPTTHQATAVEASADTDTAAVAGGTRETDTQAPTSPAAPQGEAPTQPGPLAAAAAAANEAPALAPHAGTAVQPAGEAGPAHAPTPAATEPGREPVAEAPAQPDPEATPGPAATPDAAAHRTADQDQVPAPESAPSPQPEAYPAPALASEAGPEPAPRGRVLPQIPVDAKDWLQLTDLKTRPKPFLHNARGMAWLDAATGELVHRGGRVHVDLGDQSAAALVTALHATLPAEVERVFVVAGAPWHRDVATHTYLVDAVASWLNGPLPQGWRIAVGGGEEDRDRLAGHLVHERRPVGRWQLGSGPHSRFLEIRSVLEWFDPQGASPAVCRSAFGLLWKELRRKWEPVKTEKDGRVEQVVFMGSPSQMGKELWSRTLPNKHTKGKEAKWAGGYPVQSPEVRELLHATSGQGRFELIAPPRVPEQVPELWEVDRTFAYAKHLWRGAVGAPDRLTGAAWEAMPDSVQKKLLYQSGWWQLQVTVPHGWRGPGLLPLAAPDGRSWEYPHQGGRTFTTWVGTMEFVVAREAEWTLQVVDGLVWEAGTPMRTWGERLTQVWSRLREQATHAQTAGENEQATAAHLAARAVRAITLYGIGSFASRGRDTTGTATHENHVPQNAEIIGNADGVITWRRRNRNPDAHPEWPIVDVWSANRAAQLSSRDKDTGIHTGALHLPEGVDVIASRNDSLWLTANPHWPDHGKPGNWRAKGHLPGPLATPTTETELLSLRPLARAYREEEA